MTWSDAINPNEIGDLPTSGTLFTITNDDGFSGLLEVTVYVANADELVKAYRYLIIEMSATSATPSSSNLTLVNGQASFITSASPNSDV